MKIYSHFDEASSIDKAWYKSSNIVYSECYDKKDDFKELKVVFTNGRCYLYKDVDVNDYLRFREAKSQGHVMNDLIKPTYQCVRMEDVDVNKIKEELDKFQSVPKLTFYRNGTAQMEQYGDVKQVASSYVFLNPVVRSEIAKLLGSLDVNVVIDKELYEVPDSDEERKERGVMATEGIEEIKKGMLEHPEVYKDQLGDRKIEELTLDDFDFQGNLIPHITLRKALKNLGFKEYASDKRFGIANSNKCLDLPLKVYEDDGMGYGANNGNATDCHLYSVDDESEVRIWF